MAESRTFAFLGPNNADLSVFMGGSQLMDDAVTNLSVWGFRSADGLQNGFNGDRVVPSPVIELIQGEACTLRLASGPPHTVHLHGLDTDDFNDGVPNTSGFVANSDGPFANNFGRVTGYSRLKDSMVDNRFTYNLIAPHAGTYLYHCHVDTSLHMEKGMAGTIIVRPPNGSLNLAYEDGPTFHKEYIWHLHTYDSRWHPEQVTGVTDDMVDMTAGRITSRYRPDFFMINGKDTSGTSTEISDSTVALSAFGNERVMIRVNNIGFMPATVKLGGLPFDVVASDGRPLASPLTVTELLMGAAERYDLIMTMPLNYNGTASVDYHDIRLQGVIDTVTTTVTGGEDRMFSDSFEDPTP